MLFRPAFSRFAFSCRALVRRLQPARVAFGQLARDRAGNTAAIVAAGIVPLMAMVGGGVDMSRSYLSESRLQSACDAGVLAARKKLASQVVTPGALPADIKAIGDSFFNINFRPGAYGTKNRAFTMAVETDMSISGSASVDVPTTLMQIFGYTNVPLKVDCTAKLNFSNTDVMLVLDTTGSMHDTNAGDSQPKINVLRSVVKSFHTQLETAKSPGVRIRYGFVPYSTNVNVGQLLRSAWVVDKWLYHGREAKTTGKWETYDTYSSSTVNINSNYVGITPYTAATCPNSTASITSLATWTTQDGAQHGRNEINGDYYWCNISSDGKTVTVNGTRYNGYIYEWTTQKSGTATREIYLWQYKPVQVDLAFLKGAAAADPLKLGMINVQMYGYPSPTPANLTAYFRGCMEERDTYEIKDWDNIDFTKALDLNLDLVPSGSDSTRWRPMLNEISFEPEIWWDGTGTFQKSPAPTSSDYLMARWAGLSACPAPARKLSEISDTDIDAYLAALTPEGSTYHDIGMIWGGRLISPTGLFAAENADVNGRPTSRHMIFLTDGLTAPLDLSYGTYGIEPLDQRRCTKCDNAELDSIVEKRFTVACNEVKKRNVNVWVIGFGTTLNPVMTECAGPGHSFEAKNAADLNAVFTRIAAAMGDLRISQ